MIIVCPDCDRLRPHHGKGLCGRCYQRKHALMVRAERRAWSPFCRCEVHTPEPIGVWGVQCGGCGKPYRELCTR